MEQLRRPVDGGAEDSTERLVTEADAEHRGPGPGALLDDRHGDAGVLGSAGPGETSTPS